MTFDYQTNSLTFCIHARYDAFHNEFVNIGIPTNIPEELKIFLRNLLDTFLKCNYIENVLMDDKVLRFTVTIDQDKITKVIQDFVTYSPKTWEKLTKSSNFRFVQTSLTVN
jgi:hypothetical protein